MKKKWHSIMAVLLALVVLGSTATTALAESDEEMMASPRQFGKDGLAIVAPIWSPVGVEVSMTVFGRSTQDPVKDASVWALTRDNAEALKEKLDEIKAESDDSTTAEVDWESLASIYGFLLGTTHGNGELKYTFEEEGFYLLIALKEGYRPGRTGIAIKTPPEPIIRQHKVAPEQGQKQPPGLRQQPSKKLEVH